MFSIKVVEEADLQAIEDAYPIRVGTPGDPHREQFEQQGAGQLTWLIAWIAGKPRGSVMIRWPGRSVTATRQAQTLGCPEICGLGVDDDIRGRGIGRSLMEHAEELVRAREAEMIGLEVTAGNPKQNVARRLYERLGYEDAGFGRFTSGYTYWDADGVAHRDEEPHIYLSKHLKPLPQL